MGSAVIKNAVFAALAFLGACNTPASVETGIIGSWRIEDVDGGGVIDRSRLEIQFDDAGRVSGHAGCNAFTGPYTRNGAAIDIGPLASTRRACTAEALTLQEGRVLRSLDAVTAVAATDDGALVLTGPAPARLLLRRMDDAAAVDAAAPLVVTGEVFFLERIALPPDAVLRITVEDVSRMDAAARTLARTETPASNGPPFRFRIEAPRDGLSPQSRVGVRVQILSGAALLFTSTEHHGVALSGAQAPLHIRVSPVEAASGAGGRPVTPTPTTYICGGETLRIAIEEGAAYVTLADGGTLRLERLRAAGEDPEAPRLFTNGRMTIRQNIEGPEPRVSFARGRAAFLPCTRG